MIIKTSYRPHCCFYLTVGKEYELTDDYIVDDDGVGIEISLLGCSHLEGRDWDIVEPKPFDITKHEWSDKNLFSDGSMHQGKLQIVEHDVIDGIVYLSKLDSIALAKHFKLTAEDLS